MKSMSGKQQVAIEEKVNVEACLSASSVRPRVTASAGATSILGSQFGRYSFGCLTMHATD